MVHALPLSHVVIHTENNKCLKKKKVREEGSFLAQSYRDDAEVLSLQNRGSLPTHISRAARNPDMSQAVSSESKDRQRSLERFTQQHAASVSQLCCTPTYLCPFLVPALHLDCGDGCEHLICWQVLGQPGQKLGTVDEVHPRQDILE